MSRDPIGPGLPARDGPAGPTPGDPVDERLAQERLIDAPSLPAWTGRMAAPEDAPTVRLVRPPVPVFEPSEPTTEPPTVHDPLGLEPAPQREPQVSKEETPMAAEDPRELARRLAEEAKRRLRDVPAVSDAAPPPAPARPVTERAAPPPTRTLSAKEALAAAREAERTAPPAPPAPAPAPAAPAPAPTARTSPAPAPTARPAAAAPRSAAANRAEPASYAASDYGTVVRQVFAKAAPGDGLPVLNIELFTTLWRSHRARALHDGDYGLAAAASALIDAAARLPEGALVAGSVTLDGDEWAVWVDLSRRAVLAAAKPAAVYLAG